MGFCVVAEGQLALMTLRHVRAAGWQARPVGYICGIIAAIMACIYFMRRHRRQSSEAAGSSGPGVVDIEK